MIDVPALVKDVTVVVQLLALQMVVRGVTEVVLIDVTAAVIAVARVKTGLEKRGCAPLIFNKSFKDSTS